MHHKGQMFTLTKYESHVKFNVMDKDDGYGPPPSVKYVWPQKLKVNEKHMDSSLTTDISRFSEQNIPFIIKNESLWANTMSINNQLSHLSHHYQKL